MLFETISNHKSLFVSVFYGKFSYPRRPDLEPALKGLGAGSTPLKASKMLNILIKYCIKWNAETSDTSMSSLTKGSLRMQKRRGGDVNKLIPTTRDAIKLVQNASGDVNVQNNPGNPDRRSFDLLYIIRFIINPCRDWRNEDKKPSSVSRIIHDVRRIDT